MGLFSKDKASTQTPASTQTVDAPATGKVSLAKGSSVSLAKTPDSTITASNGWAASGKDYDLKALVRYKDGRLVYVGAANVDELLSTQEGAVRHSGDAKQAGELETITIKWHPDIASVALSSYSALENGRGSFREYGVYVEIKNAQQVISLSAADASANGSQYTLCFGEVIFGESGDFSVVNLEMYSKRGSERRVGYRGDMVVMDIGPEGKSK